VAKEFMLKETYKGFVLGYKPCGNIIEIYTKEEWMQGKGYRYVEHEAGTKQEAIDFIDSY
jgi:hypothetical protein